MHLHVFDRCQTYLQDQLDFKNKCVQEVAANHLQSVSITLHDISLEYTLHTGGF